MTQSEHTSAALLKALKGLLKLHQSQFRETTDEEVEAEYAIAKAEGRL